VRVLAANEEVALPKFFVEDPEMTPVREEAHDTRRGEADSRLRGMVVSWCRGASLGYVADTTGESDSGLLAGNCDVPLLTKDAQF
jgi:hypothetical protein